MTQLAVVREIADNGDALICVQQTSACAHDCAECGGCGSARRITVRAGNPLSAEPGELVTVEAATLGVLRAAALVYLLPLAMLLGGCLLSGALGAGETGQAIAGVGGLLTGCAAAAAVNRLVRGDRPMEFTIVERRGNPLSTEKESGL